MTATVHYLPAYRMPRLVGRSVLVRDRRLDLSRDGAVALAEVLYWCHQLGTPGSGAGILVREAQGGIELRLPCGVVGVLPRKVALVWSTELHRRATERSVAQ